MGIIAYRAAHIDFGMDTTHLVTMPVDLTSASYDTPEKQLLFYQRLLSELRRDNGIDAAMVSGEQGETPFAVDDVEYNTVSDYPKASLVVVSETPVQIGFKLLEGRNFDSRDSATGLKSVVISQSLAQSYWPGASALGRRIRLVDSAGVAQEQRIVVGVVSDVRRGEDLLTTNKSTFAALYVPLPQQIVPAANILVKHRGNEASARNAMYQSVSALDAYVVPGAITSYSDMQKKLTLMATTMTDLFIRCGIFAILLAMTGIYGLSSNAVVQRTHEIGLRRAIGASDGDIIALFLKLGTRQLTTGFLISAVISVAILYFVSKFAGIGALTLSLVGVLVAVSVSALVLLAIYISTRRAVRHEPSEALRYE
jgi:ABC-type antimicrobial peptide transport system permease subunit